MCQTNSFCCLFFENKDAFYDCPLVLTAIMLIPVVLSTFVKHGNIIATGTDA